MDILRTPDERFANLPDWPFAPHYAEVQAHGSGPLRMHYVDEGPADGPPVLLLHGEPSWAYLYRHMLPPLAAAGFRVLAPDLIGFGRSDKPVQRSAHTYARQVGWLADWLQQLDLRGVTLFCQDWGGLTGLRLAAEHGERFARIAASNTGLPSGNRKPGFVFGLWLWYAQNWPWFPVQGILQIGSKRRLSAAERAAYLAPFPTKAHMAATRALPGLVPVRPDMPGAADNRAAWDVLERWDKPFLTCFSDGDPLTRGYDRVFQRRVPGAAGQPHTTIRGAGHFVQEDAGPQLAELLLRWMRA